MPDISTIFTSRLHYNKMGNGPVLVLIHGFPESSNLWRKVTADLAESFTLLIPDLPGSGLSKLDREVTIGEMADGIKAILENEGVTKGVIAGHSMGGYVAFDFAARYPQLLAGLSSVHSVPTADDEEKKIQRQKVIDLIEKGGKSGFLAQMIPNLFAPGFRQASPEVITGQLELANEMPAESLTNYYKAMIGRNDNSGILKTAPFPLQWIIGQEDNIIPFKKILEYSSKSDINFVTFVNNCGHMSMLENPGLLITALKKFTNYCYERTV